ncbi:MAG: translation elongation factor Ts [Armatimonadetes bacterium]|nr:translation elongation factor Ts [Armatimonadota bacterium]
MAEITAAQVKQLRDATGVAMMDCKKALVEAGGDFDGAVAVLRTKGGGKVDKLASRTANEGAIGTYVVEDGATGAIIEVNCETDFVARNEDFRALVSELARNAALGGASDLDAFLAAKTLNQDDKTVEDLVKEGVATLSENIVVKRIALVGAQNGVIGSYVHSDGKKGALVVAEGANTEEAKEAARGVAMQAVALRAPYLNRASVPAEVLESEKAIYRTQAAEEGKPEAMQDKIAEGRLGKYFKENTLVEQAFIRDDKKSVEQIAKEVGVTIENFVRFEVGQA